MIIKNKKAKTTNDNPSIEMSEVTAFENLVGIEIKKANHSLGIPDKIVEGEINNSYVQIRFEKTLNRVSSQGIYPKA